MPLENNWKNLLPQIYKDAAQPAVQKFGKALGAIAGYIFSPLEKVAGIGEKNMLRLVERLDAEDEEKIIPAPPELAVPILQRLQYTRAEELVNLYVELLTKASVEDTQNTAHPGYFEVITNMSVDEARVIDFLSKNTDMVNIPYVRIKANEDGKDGVYHIEKKYVSTLPDLVTFFAPDNEEVYIENLLRLGILQDMGTTYLADKRVYEDLFVHPRVKAAEALITYQGRKSEIEKSCLRLTGFGRSFIQTCVPK